MPKKMSKNTKSSLITYGIVIAAYIIMQVLISMGSISSLMEGLMVPLCHILSPIARYSKSGNFHFSG